MKPVAVIFLVGLAGCSSDATPTQPTPSSQFTAWSAPAPPSGTTYVVTGTVTSGATREPLANAIVQWAGLAEVWGDRGHGVGTGSRGEYRIQIGNLGGPGSAEGQVVMRAKKTGYQEQVLYVTLPEGATVNFALSQTNQRLIRR